MWNPFCHLKWKILYFLAKAIKLRDKLCQMGFKWKFFSIHSTARPRDTQPLDARLSHISWTFRVFYADFFCFYLPNNARFLRYTVFYKNQKTSNLRPYYNSIVNLFFHIFLKWIFFAISLFFIIKTNGFRCLYRHFKIKNSGDILVLNQHRKQFIDGPVVQVSYRSCWNDFNKKFWANKIK